MRDSDIQSNKRFELVNAILLAVVSFATALVIYLTNNASSMANTNNHEGMITAMKLEAFANENWRKAYQEASSAYSYAVASAGNQVLKSSQDPASRSQADNYERYLLPNLKLLGEPFTSNQPNTSTKGLIDIQARFSILQDSPEIKVLDPSNYFKQAEEFYIEQRWYLTGSIILAISLFWLTIAQISHKRRLLTLLVGCSFFVSGILWVISYMISRGGA